METLSDFLAKYETQINEVRRFLFVSLMVFLVFGGLGVVFPTQIMAWIMSFFDLSKVNIVLTTPYQFFNLSVTLGLAMGVVATFPVVLLYAVKFIKPALNEHEYKFVKKIVPISLALFVFGCIFGAKIEQMVVVMYATSSGPLQNYWDVESFLSQVLIMTVTMGLVFQLPIVLTAMIKMKFFTRDSLAKQRKFVYVGLTIFGMMLPPNDALSLILIIAPLFILFESTLLFNKG